MKDDNRERSGEPSIGQGPFLGARGHHGPGPAGRATVLLGRKPSRWTTLSRHPGSRPVPCRFIATEPGSPCVCSLGVTRGAHRAADRPSLGPRSLAPPLFLERCVRAYSRPDAAFRLLQRFLRRTGKKDPGPRVPHLKTMAATIFLVLTHHARPWRGPLRLRGRRTSQAVTRREPRNVRSMRPRCRFLLLSQVCPTAIPIDRSHSRTSDDDVHGSLERAKDVSSSGERLVWRLADECVRFAHADDVPLLATQRTPAVIGALARRGGTRYARDGPTEIHVLPEAREGC